MEERLRSATAALHVQSEGESTSSPESMDLVRRAESPTQRQVTGSTINDNQSWEKEPPSYLINLPEVSQSDIPPSIELPVLEMGMSFPVICSLFNLDKAAYIPGCTKISITLDGH
jgi:hypothetical protein